MVKKNGQRPLLYTVDQAAALLQLSEPKIRQLIARGVIPSLRLDKAIRVPAAALRKLTQCDDGEISI
jgi:excisionase family DNA binding protein